MSLTPLNRFERRRLKCWLEQWTHWVPLSEQYSPKKGKQQWKLWIRTQKNSFLRHYFKIYCLVYPSFVIDWQLKWSSGRCKEHLVTWVVKRWCLPQWESRMCHPHTCSFAMRVIWSTGQWRINRREALCLSLLAYKQVINLESCSPFHLFQRQPQTLISPETQHQENL